MSTCPYCGDQLDRVPKRRTACPSCRRAICVRKGRLCTEEEARALDWCAHLQIDELAFCRARETLSAEFGQSASCSDAVWRLMNETDQRACSWHERKMIYLQMARFLWEEKRDCLEVQRQAVRMQLADWKEKADMGLLDLRRVRLQVITAKGASCSECRALDGRLVTFDEAQLATLVPVASCTHEKMEGWTRGWCRCEYGLSFA
jgi:hypothetical protein